MKELSMNQAVNIKKLEADLWESADLLRVGSKLTYVKKYRMICKNLWRKNYMLEIYL